MSNEDVTVKFDYVSKYFFKQMIEKSPECQFSVVTY